MSDVGCSKSKGIEFAEFCIGRYPRKGRFESAKGFAKNSHSRTFTSVSCISRCSGLHAILVIFILEFQILFVQRVDGSSAFPRHSCPPTAINDSAELCVGMCVTKFWLIVFFTDESLLFWWFTVNRFAEFYFEINFKPVRFCEDAVLCFLFEKD